ncbi:MAG: hypothetical protein ACYDA9_06925 [Terriglobia bacterium]
MIRFVGYLQKEAHLMPVLRVTRKVVDWVIIVGMILFVIFRFGILGNAYAPPLDSPIEDWGEVAGCFLWVIVPLAATVLAFKTRQLAGYACFVGVPLAAYVPAANPFLRPLDDSAFWSEVMAAVFIAVGLYWLLTSSFGCPPGLAPLTQPSRLRRWALISGGVLACGLGLIWTVFIIGAPQLLVDCYVVPPSAKPKFPNQEVFIATDAVSFGRKPAANDRGMSYFGGFAIARVREQFWGLPWWSKKFVLLWRPSQWRGKTYFYDGARPVGLLTQFFPIVIYVGCSRTNLVNDAEIDLRVLHDGPSQTRGRIFGRAYHPTGEGPWQLESGIKVTITGSSGKIVTTTDEKGFFDAPALPPGEYSVHF